MLLKKTANLNFIRQNININAKIIISNEYNKVQKCHNLDYRRADQASFHVFLYINK